MKRPLFLIELPPPEEGERRHTFAGEDGEGLRLVEPSPACPCAECVWLQVQQNKERNGG